MPYSAVHTVALLSLLVSTRSWAQTVNAGAADPLLAPKVAPSELAQFQLEFQADELRKEREAIHIGTPLVVGGAGLLLIGGGFAFAEESQHCLDTGATGRICTVAGTFDGYFAFVGLLTLTAGIVWFVIDLVVRGDLERQLRKLEATLGQPALGQASQGGVARSDFVLARF